jgi:hypothetical protein
MRCGESVLKCGRALAYLTGAAIERVKTTIIGAKHIAELIRNTTILISSVALLAGCIVLTHEHMNETQLQARLQLYTGSDVDLGNEAAIIQVSPEDCRLPFLRIDPSRVTVLEILRTRPPEDADNVPLINSNLTTLRAFFLDGEKLYKIELSSASSPAKRPFPTPQQQERKLHQMGELFLGIPSDIPKAPLKEALTSAIALRTAKLIEIYYASETLASSKWVASKNWIIHAWIPAEHPSHGLR